MTKPVPKGASAAGKLKPRKKRKTLRRLTDKQMAFCTWYVSAAVNMNAVEAARRAGYQGKDATLRSIASHNMTKPAIRAEVDKRMAVAMSGADITVEAVLRKLSVICEQSIAEKQFAPATRCIELHGKYLKMFTEKIEHVGDITEMSTDDLIRLLHEITEAGNLDLGQLIKSNGSHDGSVPDPAATPTTH